jgi:hypothetical protein
MDVAMEFVIVAFHVWARQVEAETEMEMEMETEMEMEIAAAEQEEKMPPRWLLALLSEKSFFGACAAHGGQKKNERNVFCVDCACAACQHCIPAHPRSSHTLLQVGFGRLPVELALAIANGSILFVLLGLVLGSALVIYPFDWARLLFPIKSSPHPPVHARCRWRRRRRIGVVIGGMGASCSARQSIGFWGQFWMTRRCWNLTGRFVRGRRSGDTCTTT